MVNNVHVCRGPEYGYLGIILRFTGNGKLEASMTDYLKKTINEFPDMITVSVSTPAGEHLFTVNKKPIPMYEERAAAFHTIVTHLPFVTMRFRRDIQTAMVFLCTRVKEPDKDNCKTGC